MPDPLDGHAVITYRHEPYENLVPDNELVRFVGVKPTRVHPEYGQMYGEFIVTDNLVGPTAEELDEGRKPAAQAMARDTRYITNMDIIRNVVKQNNLTQQW